MKEYITIVHSPKRLITKIHFGGNGNHTFFVSDDIGLCVNQGTGFLLEKIHARFWTNEDFIIICIYSSTYHYTCHADQ
jgi:hypothetical protein